MNVERIGAALSEVRQSIAEVREAAAEVADVADKIEMVLDTCGTLGCHLDPEVIGFVAGRLDGARLRQGDSLVLLAHGLDALLSLDEP